MGGASIEALRFSVKGPSQWCPPRLGSGERVACEVHPPTEGRKTCDASLQMPQESLWVWIPTRTSHVAVALDALGRRLGTLSIPTTRSGYEKNGAGVGTGSPAERRDRRHRILRCRTYPLLRRAEGTRVFDGSSRRRDQYRSGKSDPIDAELAARAVLAGTATAEPKDTDGEVETTRVAGYAPLSGKGSCSGRQPTEELTHHRSRRAKERVRRGLSTAKLVAKVSGFRPGASPSNVEAATKFSSCAQQRAATNGSPKRSPNSTSNWIVWWLKRRRSWLPWRAKGNSHGRLAAHRRW